MSLHLLTAFLLHWSPVTAWRHEKRKLNSRAPQKFLDLHTQVPAATVPVNHPCYFHMPCSVHGLQFSAAAHLLEHFSFLQKVQHIESLLEEDFLSRITLFNERSLLFQTAQGTSRNLISQTVFIIKLWASFHTSSPCPRAHRAQSVCPCFSQHNFDCWFCLTLIVQLFLAGVPHSYDEKHMQIRLVEAWSPGLCQFSCSWWGRVSFLPAPTKLGLWLPPSHCCPASGSRAASLSQHQHHRCYLHAHSAAQSAQSSSPGIAR